MERDLGEPRQEITIWAESLCDEDREDRQLEGRDGRKERIGDRDSYGHLQMRVY